MSKFQLSGFQRDTVNALAIHQDTPGLVAFIEELVNEQINAPEVPSVQANDGGTQATAQK